MVNLYRRVRHFLFFALADELCRDISGQRCQLFEKLEAFACFELRIGKCSCNDGSAATTAKVPEDFIRLWLGVL